MGREGNPPKFTAESENGVFWVNSEHCCLGRFTPNGFEVYQDMGGPTEIFGASNTLAVRMKNTDEKEWVNFKKLMLEHHGIDLDSYDYPGNKE